MARLSSAGLLLYRFTGDGVLQVLIAHMGGPFWAKKDLRGWSIPKGEYSDGEDPLEVARREFKEELGQSPPAAEVVPLGEVKQRSGKVITVWAAHADLDVSTVSSNTFSMEWPRGSGHLQDFPEIDRAEWCDVAVARDKLVAGQVPFLDVLVDSLRPI